MKTRKVLLLLGIGVGVSAPIIAKAARPLAAYAVAGGMIAYEAICDAMESSKEVLSASIKRAGDKLTNGEKS